MSELEGISLAILIILILVGIITVVIDWKRKKEGTLGEPNYKAFFLWGLLF